MGGGEGQERGKGGLSKRIFFTKNPFFEGGGGGG